MSQILLTDAETEAQEVKHTLMGQEKSPALLQVMVRVKLFAPERLQGGNLEFQGAVISLTLPSVLC